MSSESRRDRPPAHATPARPASTPAADGLPAGAPAEPFHRHAQRVIVALFGLFLGIMLARGFHF